jgi:hypothetical protein
MAKAKDRGGDRKTPKKKLSKKEKKLKKAKSATGSIIPPSIQKKEE